MSFNRLTSMFETFKTNNKSVKRLKRNLSNAFYYNHQFEENGIWKITLHFVQRFFFKKKNIIKRFKVNIVNRINQYLNVVITIYPHF